MSIPVAEAPAQHCEGEHPIPVIRLHQKSLHSQGGRWVGEGGVCVRVCVSELGICFCLAGFLLKLPGTF